MNKCIKCRNCRYFSGVKCHGHGEFFGSCVLLDFCLKENETVGNYDYINTFLKIIVFDDTECIIMKKFEIEGVNFDKQKN